MSDDIRPSDMVQDALPDQVLDFGQSRPLPNIEEIEEALRDVVDPELMINIVDLGLIYGINLEEDGSCAIDMTLTSPTCPMTDRLEYDIKSVLSSMVRGVCINWVWMPPWSLELITEDGREQLRAIGFAI